MRMENFSFSTTKRKARTIKKPFQHTEKAFILGAVLNKGLYFVLDMKY